MMFMLMGFVWSMSLNLNNCGVFWTNQAQMEQNAVGWYRAGGGLQVPSGLLQLECTRVLHETLLVPVLMYALRQCYGRRRRDLE